METTKPWDGNAIRKVLVLNGSPKRKASTTMVVTNAFLAGLNADNRLDVEVIDVSSLRIKPCTGCLHCWGQSEGTCVIKDDDIPALKQKILDADIIIQSYPLYFFSMPGEMKVMMDRLLSMMCTYEGQEAPKNGESFHGFRYPNPNQRLIVISGCAYTEAAEVYRPLLAQYDCIFGKKHYTPIFVPQLRTLCDYPNERKRLRFLEKFTEAGRLFRQDGKLSEEEIALLWKPPFAPKTYQTLLNVFWTSEREKGRK